jgi:hypothetical protein
MNGTRLRNQIKERLMIETVQCFEIHRTGWLEIPRLRSE